MPGNAGHSTALSHALGWLVVGNAVGLYLSLLLLFPNVRFARWTCGRWAPVLLTGKCIGSGWSVVAWHLAALVMIVTLAFMGWREGEGPSWMLSLPAWRESGLVIRSASGLLMLWVSMIWLMERRTI